MTGAEIKQEAARRVARMDGLTAAERRAEQERLEAALRAEAEAAEQAKAAAAVEAEAAAERARIAGVIRTGADLGRARQAARLAVTTPLDATGAKAVLGTLPTDAAASPDAMMITSEVGTFGTPAAVAERRRVASILGHAEAEGRFPVAAALAVETALDPAQALAALMAAPRQAAQRFPSLEERSREAGSFGPDFHNTSGLSKGERTDALWTRAIRQANAEIGAVPSGPADAATPKNPTINDAERAAMHGAGAALEQLKGNMQ